MSVGRVIGYGCEIEDNDVGVGAWLDPALSPSDGCGSSETLRWHEAHLADGIGQGEALLRSNVPSKNPAEGSCLSRMSTLAITGDHYKRIANVVVNGGLFVEINQDGLRMRICVKLFEALRG